MSAHFARLLLLCAFVLALVSCGTSAASRDAGDGRTLEALSIEAPETLCGAVVVFRAMATWAGGTREDVSAQASWLRDGVSVADGKFARSADEIKITVIFRDRSVSRFVSFPACDDFGPIIQPTISTIAIGAKQSFEVTVATKDGAGSVVTMLAVWASADATIATVNEAGVAIGRAPGTTTITATYEGRVGSAVLTVAAPKIISITIEPPSLTLAVGMVHAFSATAVYDDKTIVDVTNVATWKSSDDTIATVDATGRVKALRAPAEATITATANGVSGTAKLKVTE